MYNCHICMYLHVYASTRQLEAYHMRSLPLERHGMNGLMSLPIAVIDIDTGKELQWAGHVGNVHKPFPYRMELARRELPVPAIGRRQLQAGNPIRKIIQDKMNQFVGEVAKDRMILEHGGLR